MNTRKTTRVIQFSLVSATEAQVKDEPSYAVGWFPNQQNPVHLNGNPRFRKPVGILLASAYQIPAKILIVFRQQGF